MAQSVVLFSLGSRLFRLLLCLHPAQNNIHMHSSDMCLCALERGMYQITFHHIAMLYYLCGMDTAHACLGISNGVSRYYTHALWSMWYAAFGTKCNWIHHDQSGLPSSTHCWTLVCMFTIH